MYDIATLELDDGIVMVAVNAIINGQTFVPGPGGNYRLFAVNDKKVIGDGGANRHVLVIVGHGGANELSGCRTWTEFRQSVTGGVDWSNAATVYVAACSTLGEDGTQFLHGSIANDIKAAFPGATVWASTSNVRAGDLAGNWERLR